MSSENDTTSASLTAATGLVMHRHHLSAGDASAHVHEMAELRGVAAADLAPLLIRSYDETSTKD